MSVQRAVRTAAAKLPRGGLAPGAIMGMPPTSLLCLAAGQTARIRMSKIETA